MLAWKVVSLLMWGRVNSPSFFHRGNNERFWLDARCNVGGVTPPGWGHRLSFHPVSTKRPFLAEEEPQGDGEGFNPTSASTSFFLFLWQRYRRCCMTDKHLSYAYYWFWIVVSSSGGFLLHTLNRWPCHRNGRASNTSNVPYPPARKWAFAS